MTVTAGELALFSGALAILFLTPGPVMLAMTARTLSGGFAAAWPLALGVVLGDIAWALLAMLGMSWVVAQYGATLTILKWLAAVVFLWMGVGVLRNANKPIANDSALTAPGMWAGFLAGLMAIIGNPKAILFYMGMLPGFFTMTTLNAADITVICVLAGIIPFAGNMLFASLLQRVRGILESPTALRRLNLTAGTALIALGFSLPFIG